ncbi:SRPBCC family protein [Coprobacter tertius]|uniref:SRPBCC family protein n=1 Tax=Coprobacter tertius TaxID=2944915 RepID=A0ABT1MKD5_9BACT|nr:SRPBCC family protein [Coprobacter tertius]MCP9613080.1 SRPBCC family protein [Coprobacter tertius]
MTQFESQVKTINSNIGKVYNTLSDLNNLEKVQDKLPADKISDFTFDTDSCSFSVNPIGNVTVKVIEREPEKTIKFTTEKSPIPLYFWIQLVPVTENECKLKLTVKAELNPFIKSMISKPLQQGLDKIAEVLANVVYE